MISFEELYGSDNDNALSVFLLFCQELFTGLGIDPVAIELSTAQQFVNNLREDEFPACDQFGGASPFKKAANMYVWLHAVDPFTGRLPPELFGSQVASFPHSVASIVGLMLVRESLYGVTLKREGGDVILSQRIAWSRHFFNDLIEASNGISPRDHFKTYSLLFEALAYRSNTRASYADMFAAESI